MTKLIPHAGPWCNPLRPVCCRSHWEHHARCSLAIMKGHANVRARLDNLRRNATILNDLRSFYDSLEIHTFARRIVASRLGPCIRSSVLRTIGIYTIKSVGRAIRSSPPRPLNFIWCARVTMVDGGRNLFPNTSFSNLTGHVLWSCLFVVL